MRISPCPVWGSFAAITGLPGGFYLALLRDRSSRCWWATFARFRVQELSTRETAEILGLTVEAVKVE